MGFSRQEYQSGLPFPSPGDIPRPGIEPRSPTLQADALSSEPPGKPNIIGLEIANPSRSLAWEIPWTEEPGGLQSKGLQRVGHSWATEQAQTSNYIKTFLIYEFGLIYFAQYEKIRNIYDNRENGLIISCHETNWPFNPKVWIWKYPQLLLHVGNKRSQVKSLFCVLLLYSLILGTGQSYILLSSYKCTWLVFPSFSTYF